MRAPRVIIALIVALVVSACSGYAPKKSVLDPATHTNDAQVTRLAPYETARKSDAEQQATQANCRTTNTISCTRKADAE